jgi:hypothetical protein
MDHCGCGGSSSGSSGVGKHDQNSSGHDAGMQQHNTFTAAVVLMHNLRMHWVQFTGCVTDQSHVRQLGWLGHHFSLVEAHKHLAH